MISEKENEVTIIEEKNLKADGIAKKYLKGRFLGKVMKQKTKENKKKIISFHFIVVNV